MAARFLEQVRTAISNLNPKEIRHTAERRLHILVDASTPDAYIALEDFLCPASFSHARRWQAVNSLHRAMDFEPRPPCDLLFYEQGRVGLEGWIDGRNAFAFDPLAPAELVDTILASRDELMLPLARMFPPFRGAASKRAIHTIARENAVISLVSALPNVVPSLAGLPWAAGELASDTALLTANQVRMAFLLAAASDREVGYREQRNEIASIIAGAWGWRSLARELAGKIPFGGGLIPKAAIAYAGTFVVGQSLERLYRLGYGLTRRERKAAYEQAFVRGKEVAGGLLEKVRRKG